MNGNGNVPVEVQSTTHQINSMLSTIKEREASIEALKEARKKYEDSALKFDALQDKIKDLKDSNKRDNKLIEMLVEYVKNNYGFDFTPGDLFNQDEANCETETEKEEVN